VRAHDTAEKSWRHLNFFQHEAHLHARVPRVRCGSCGVRVVEVPWARPGSGFTLLFEALVLTLVKEMPVQAVARLIGEHDTRIWRVLHHYVGEARAAADFSEVRAVGLDETASKRGHQYITLFMDLDASKLLFATEGRDATTLAAFRADLEAHGGKAEQVEEICMDMSPAFRKGAAASFPEASLTFDKFHVMQLINTAVDTVRREERKTRPELKGTRYVWTKNPGISRSASAIAWRSSTSAVWRSRRPAPITSGSPSRSCGPWRRGTPPRSSRRGTSGPRTAGSSR
jgi:transposase